MGATGSSLYKEMKSRGVQNDDLGTSFGNLRQVQQNVVILTFWKVKTVCQMPPVPCKPSTEKCFSRHVNDCILIVIVKNQAKNMKKCVKKTCDLFFTLNLTIYWICHSAEGANLPLLSLYFITITWAIDLLEKMKKLLAPMDHPFDKEDSIAIITTTIRDVLWLELPESYGKDHTQYREAMYNYLRDRYDRAA